MKASGDERSRTYSPFSIFLFILTGPVAIYATNSCWPLLLTIVCALASFLLEKRFWVSCAIVAVFSTLFGFVIGIGFLPDGTHSSRLEGSPRNPPN